MTATHTRNRRRHRGIWSGVSATDMLRIRRRVRHTASLVSTTGPIKERPSSNWAANYRERIIYWRATDPFTRELMADEEILMNTVHEAGHLNWTGGYSTPEGFSRMRFHRFWNAVEDIRIERLMSREFPGFASVRANSNKICHEFHKQAQHTGEYSLLDQVWLSYMGLEENLGTLGSPGAQQFAKDTWPQISRVANSHDSAMVADGIAPVYKEIIDAMKESRDPLIDNLPDGWDEHGLDELTTHPTRSSLPELTEEGELENPVNMHGKGEGQTGEPNEDGTDIEPPKGELTADLPGLQLVILQGMGEDAEGQAKQFLYAILTEEQDAANEADEQAELIVSPMAGHGNGEPNNTGNPRAWKNAHDRMRKPINVLHRRLISKLRANAEDDWENGLRKGSLDMSRAPVRAAAGNMRVFRDRHAISDLEYYAMLGVDVSGSQHGRATQLLDATALLLEGCEAAGVHNACLPWESNPGVVKPFGRPLKRYSSYLGGAIAQPTGGTYEAPFLVEAIDQFSRLPRNAKTLLINVTDGQTMGQDESEDLIDELTALKVICIGIGVGCPAPTHWPHSYSVKKAEQLAIMFPDIITSLVRGR